MIKNKPYFFFTPLYRALPFASAKKMITALLLCASVIPALSQEKNSIPDKFDTYRQQYLQEKIFVHTDKKNYVTGEICWFKIYVTDAYFNRPLHLDKVAYIEISDKNNQPVLQAKIALNKATGNGSFYLPAGIASGNYRLRAYTNWMKNGGADYFFEKMITIINPEKIITENIVQTKPVYEIAFFPEGGNLVNGLESKVGFKINNQYGKGTDAEGFLINGQGDTITAFHTLKFGLGSFSFTPAEGYQYKALIKLTGGEQLQKELPAAYKNGYVMHLENTHDGHIKISVAVPDKNNSSASLFLFVHTRNVIKAAVTGSIQDGKAIFIIDDTKPGDGISHFTIFDDKIQPVCERLYYKKPVQALQIAVTPDHSFYTLRNKIAVDISTSAEDGKAIPANMSMAVYKIDSLNTLDETAINSYLLLTSDLVGAVESPEYYFTNNDDTVNIALDNLMLTQGWRRFNWQDILSDKKSALHFLPEINGHIITGKITALQPGLSVQHIPAYLSAPGTLKKLQNATADEDGNVKFEIKDFYSNGELIVQTEPYDSLYRVDIDHPFFPGYSSKKIPAFSFTGLQDALLKTYIGTQVQNSFFSNQLSRSVIPPADSNAFYIKPYSVYLLDRYVRFTTLEEVLREYVPEVLVRRRNGKFNLVVFDEVNKVVFDQAPLVLLDGIPIFDFDKLMAFDALKIKKLEVETKKYLLGNNSFHGVVNFSSYKADGAGFEIDPHAAVIDYEGLQAKREFYSPVYNTEVKLNSRLPDFRNLLYWSPDVISNSNGKQQTVFYSSDLPGKYALVIQGLSDDGRAGAAVVYFDVNKP
jgi:hypothetical protein